MKDLRLAFEFIPAFEADYNALEVMNKRDLDELEEGLRLEHLLDDYTGLRPMATLRRYDMAEMWHDLFSRRRREPRPAAANDNNWTSSPRVKV